MFLGSTRVARAHDHLTCIICKKIHVDISIRAGVAPEAELGGGRGGARPYLSSKWGGGAPPLQMGGALSAPSPTSRKPR